MKISISKPLKDNIYNLMRQLGYRNQGQVSFVKPLDFSGYPRFHIYLEEKNDQISINLHLDQKRPVYKRGTAHSGEYEGKIIAEEAERIKKVFN